MIVFTLRFVAKSTTLFVQTSAPKPRCTKNMLANTRSVKKHTAVKIPRAAPSTRYSLLILNDNLVLEMAGVRGRHAIPLTPTLSPECGTCTNQSVGGEREPLEAG